MGHEPGGGFQEASLERLASPAHIQMPLGTPTQDPGSLPVGLALDPCHCSAILLPLGLGPEQVVPAFLIAPAQVGTLGLCAQLECWSRTILPEGA